MIYVAARNGSGRSDPREGSLDKASVMRDPSSGSSVASTLRMFYLDVDSMALVG